MRIAAAALLILPGLAAHAQGWPAKPIRAIVPAAGGSPTDLVARSLAPRWQAGLGQPLVVENRLGANGIIGADACAKSAPDGYTVCFLAEGQVVLNPLIYAKLPYDATRDFVPVVQLVDINALVAVPASLPVNSMKELLALSRSQPGKLNWSSWGVGSISHLYLAWLESRAGANFVHVPYKDPIGSWTAVVSGQAQAISTTAGLIAPMVKAGKVKAIGAVATKRSSLLPDVPTLQEQGLDLAVTGWLGLMVPAGTTQAIVARLNAETNRALSSREYADKSLRPFGLEPAGGSPEDFAARIGSARTTWTELVRIAGVKPQ